MQKLKIIKGRILDGRWGIRAEIRVLRLTVNLRSVRSEVAMQDEGEGGNGGGGGGGGGGRERGI